MFESCGFHQEENVTFKVSSLDFSQVIKDGKFLSYLYKNSLYLQTKGQLCFYFTSDGNALCNLIEIQTVSHQ